MRNKNLELKLTMVCNEIFNFLCFPGNGANVLDISISEIDGLKTTRVKKITTEKSEKIKFGKYEIHYHLQEKNLVKVSLYHPKYEVIYSKIIEPGTERRMLLSCWFYNNSISPLHVGAVFFSFKKNLL